MAMESHPQRIIVTGGSGGIGRSILSRFMVGGSQVLNLDRVPPEPTHAELAAAGFVRVDLADARGVRTAFNEADRHFGGQAPDVLVCAAAISMKQRFLDVEPADFDRVFGINVRGTLFACQEAARRMRAKGAGRIVIVTSISAVQGWAEEPLYCISKAAQSSMVSTLAVELAPFGILVNGVAPGVIDVRSREMSGSRTHPDVRRHYHERIPLGRFGSPKEVAEAIWYLSHSTYMTGQTLCLDGGFMATGLGYISSREDATSAPLGITSRSE